MTVPKPISQAANDAAERYFAMRKNSPDHADRSLAEMIQGACDAETEPLKQWIRDEAEHTDVCTFGILGEICEGCRCERGRK